MEFDDNMRANVGIAICLRDMGNGTSRIFLDDVSSDAVQNPIQWSYQSFFTFSPEIKNDTFDNFELTDEQLRQIGESVVTRLLALSGRVK